MKKKSIFALVNYAMPLMALAFACASCGEKGSGPGPDPDPGEGGDGDVELPSTPSYNFKGSAYITKVLDFMPAPGQFSNTLPAYAEGDDQEAMNQKVLNAIGNNKRGMISLGGFGGYVIVGFDHTIENKAGLRDFRVLGNAYKNSSEPGVIMVALDRNQNGQPDDDEWYEIAGSAHQKAFQESWYAAARENGNDVDIHRNYEITFWAKNDTNKRQTDIYKKAIEDFEAIYPNITVNLRLYTDYGKIYNDVITNISTGTTPNVCITYPDHIATYLTGDQVVVPLNDLFADSRFGLGGSEIAFDSPTREEIIPQFLDECSFNGTY